MKPTRYLAPLLGVGLLLLGLGGCLPPTSSNNGGNNSADPINLSLDGSVSALPSEAGTSALTRAAGDQTFTGTLYATPSGGGTTSEFFWSVTVHPDFTMESNSTVILFPGDYDFDLVVSDSSADQQYVGSVSGFSIIDGENTVPLVLRPVIGDTIVDAFVLDRIADFRVSYPELPILSMTTPVLRIKVDDGAWSSYSLNPATGQSVDYVMNVPQGVHDIMLELYDGSSLRGRSQVDQAPVDVQPGVSIVMDLISLHGETVLALSEEGDDATFSFTLPAEAVDEAGGLGDLEVRMSVTQGTDLWEELLSLSLNTDGSASASTVLSPMQFGEVTIVLELVDVGEDPEFALGGCAVSAVLSTSGSTVDCPLTLHRRAIFGGALLSTLGVNVYTTTGEPVSGAEVYLNDVLVGVTGSGAFGTPGYLKIVRTAGDYTVRAESIALGKKGDEDVTLAPLGIHNVNIFLDQDLITEAVFDYAGGIVPFTVPAGVTTVTIEAWGASAGHSTETPTYLGGNGARMRGDFSVAPGDVLLIVAGGEGESGWAHGSGGGGSFVALIDAGASDVMAAPAYAGLQVAPMLIAGGGGGVRVYASQNGHDAVTGQYATTGSNSSPSGGGAIKTTDLGLGGQNGTISWGSGGGGFRGDGVADPGYSLGGSSFLNGGDGGTDLISCSGDTTDGGFGGGGGTGCGGGGGGGGYSGGDGGYIAGGAGSFNAGAAQSNTAGANTGNGQVVISW